MLGHKKAVLQFSGGKDSLAALYLCRPWLDDIEVHFGNTGAVFPHIVEFVKRTCGSLGANLKIIEPDEDIGAYHKAHGLPSDIVPVWSSADAMTGEPPKVQSALTCCYNMLWKPLALALMRSEATLCIRGTKDCDERLGLRGERARDASGMEYFSPVWDWSDGGVLEYLSKEGAEIPPQYPKVDDGMDCWLCTGHLRTHYGMDRMKYIMKHFPEYAPEISRRAGALKAILHAEQDKVDKVLNIAMEVDHAA